MEKGNWIHPILAEDLEACKTLTTIAVPVGYKGYQCNDCKSTFIVWPPYSASQCPVCLKPLTLENELRRISKETINEKEKQ